jgi:predicted outer membrane repeat protein
MRTRYGTRLGIGLATVALAISAVASSAAACVVGTGSSASCTDAALNACLPGGSNFDGIVTFNCGGAKTIDISTSTGTKTISADTTIDGGGLVTISGGNSVGVFHVNPGIAFTVRNLTIANGDGGTGNGGGIYNDGGTVRATGTTFAGNKAGDSGGGLYNDSGTVIVSDCTFDRNQARDGGGLFSEDGMATVTDSTFDTNSASNSGGGIYVYGPMTLANSTLVGNTGSGSGGGAIYIDGGGTLTMTNCTISGNSGSLGGGIWALGDPKEMTLTNTIIANNTNGDCVIGSGTIIDGGHNLIEDTGANACGLTDGVKGNVIGQDPNLDPAGLQNNGGPTQTVAVLGGSPAINAGDEAVCAAPPVSSLDQRGYFRPGASLPNCTIGAYEYGAGPPGVSAPALSPVVLLGLGALLIGAGTVSVRRRASSHLPQ